VLDFLKFLVVLTKFPSCSSDSQCVPQHVCQVPNVFCNIFPIIPHFMSYPLALNFTLLTSISNPKGRDCNINILGLSKA